MQLGETYMEETRFAEAASDAFVRLIVTAKQDDRLAQCEPAVGDRLCLIDHCLRRRSEGGGAANFRPTETPDGRPGASILLLRLLDRLARVGRAEPHGAVPDDLSHDGGLRRLARFGKNVPLGKHIQSIWRRLSKEQTDYQRPALLAHSGDGRRVPGRGFAGHRKAERRRHLIVQADSLHSSALAAARRADNAIADGPAAVITPLSGGVAAQRQQGRLSIQMAQGARRPIRFVPASAGWKLALPTVRMPPMKS